MEVPVCTQHTTSRERDLVDTLIVATGGSANGGQAALAVIALIAIFVAIAWLKSMAKRAALRATVAGVKKVARIANNRTGDTTTDFESTEVGD